MSDKVFLLKDGPGKCLMLWSRCEDEQYCQAELLLLLDSTPAQHSEVGKVLGSYAVDSSFPVSQFMKAFQGKEKQFEIALQRVRRGEFNFPVVDELRDEPAKGEFVMELTPGRYQKEPTREESEESVRRVRETVARYMPELVEMVRKVVRSRGKKKPIITLHQDGFAAGYHQDEIVLLGLAVKYAGLFGVSIMFVGKNGESLSKGRSG